MKIEGTDVYVRFDRNTMARLVEADPCTYILRLTDPDTTETLHIRISDITADDIRETIRQKGPTDPPPNPSDHISGRWLALADNLERTEGWLKQADLLLVEAIERIRGDRTDRLRAGLASVLNSFRTEILQQHGRCGGS